MVVFLVLYFLSSFPFSYIKKNPPPGSSVCKAQADKQRDVSEAAQEGLIVSRSSRCCSELHKSFVTIYSEGFWGQLWRNNSVLSYLEAKARAVVPSSVQITKKKTTKNKQKQKKIIFVRCWQIIPGCCGLCRDQWTNAAGKRQHGIINKGIRGLDPPPKFFTNPKYWTSEQPPHLCSPRLSLAHFLLQSVTKRRRNVNSQCWNLLPLHMCSPFCHSHLHHM